MSTGFTDPLADVEDMLAAGDGAGAAQACAQLAAQGRGGLRLQVLHARALTACGRPSEALVRLREVRLLSPDSAEVAAAQGEAHAALGDAPAAINEYQRVVRIAPADGAAHLALAALWLEAGEPDRADASFARALELGASDDDGAMRHRARVQALRDAQRAAPGYVRQLFNQFAGDYDERMRGKLGYAAPDILAGISGFLLEPGRLHDVLDLGCGTGLSGIAFKPAARRLVGIDLSPRMLERAQALGIYDRLVEGDVEQALACTGETFDIAVAADVLVYLGDLAPLFASVHAVLRPGGLWFFTTESAGDGDYELGPKRRYRHGADYLRRLAEAAGFETCSLVECVPRHEVGQPVASWAVALRRP